MKVKAKYPIKIGSHLVPSGTIGVVLPEPTPRIKKFFPGLETGPGGKMYLVKFGDLDECLVFKKQVEVINEDKNDDSKGT